MQLAALGLFVFELATLPFEKLDRDRDWRHARTPRVGARDAVQFVGPGEDKIRISGCLVPQVAGSFAAIETLVSMGDEGEVYSFVDGAGRVWGSYTIDRLSEGQEFFLDNGVPRKVDFTLELSRVD